MLNTTSRRRELQRLPMRASPRSAVAFAVVATLGAALLAAQPALAQGRAASRTNVKSVTTTLVSAGAHKECFSLSMQQKLRYWYRADSAVNFNIQYVEGKETHYPLKKDHAAIGSGTFRPKLAEDYCVVWTNIAKRPVTLTFEYARVSG